MKDLTPKIGPHRHDIATWRRSTERSAGARPVVVLTREVDRLRRRLEHLGGLPDRVDVQAELIETGIGGGARRGSNRCPAWLVLPADLQIAGQLNELTVGLPITGASRR